MQNIDDDQAAGRPIQGEVKEDEEEEEDAQELARKQNISLLDQHTELKKIAEGKFEVFQLLLWFLNLQLLALNLL